MSGFELPVKFLTDVLLGLDVMTQMFFLSLISEALRWETLTFYD